MKIHFSLFVGVKIELVRLHASEIRVLICVYNPKKKYQYLKILFIYYPSFLENCFLTVIKQFFLFQSYNKFFINK